MKQRSPGVSDERNKRFGGVQESAPERGTEDEKPRDHVVAPDPDSIWAEVSSIVEIDVEPPEVPRWLKSS
jgi:hypothetical protein